MKNKALREKKVLNTLQIARKHPKDIYLNPYHMGHFDMMMVKDDDQARSIECLRGKRGMIKLGYIGCTWYWRDFSSPQV